MIRAFGRDQTRPAPVIALRRGGVAAGIVAAALGFFATVALAQGLAAARLVADWSGPQARVATLHVVAAEEAVEAQARAALEVLRTTPGVTAVRLVEIEEQRALLAPWFGPDVALDGLPLPLLIEVEADGAVLEREALAGRLAAEAPGAVYDDHAAWRAPLAAGAERLRLIALVSLAAMALALGAALALVAGASVAAEGAAVRVLRLVGARDRFIAAAFLGSLVRRAAAGAAVGAALAAALMAAPGAGPAAGGSPLGLGFEGWGWLAPLAVPAAAAAVAWTAGALAVRRAVRRWS
jgi:cell division transport system permease protein